MRISVIKDKGIGYLTPVDKAIVKFAIENNVKEAHSSQKHVTLKDMPDGTIQVRSCSTYVESIGDVAKEHCFISYIRVK